MKYFLGLTLIVFALASCKKESDKDEVFVESIVGEALHFDGVDDKVVCDDALLLDGENKITLEALIKFDSFATTPARGSIINKERGKQMYEYGYMIRAGGNGVVSFNLGDNAWHETVTDDNAISLNTWHHIAATYDGQSSKIYIDGSLVKEESLLNIDIKDTLGTHLTIGDWASNGATRRAANATIDQVRVWNIARTASQISSNKFSGLSSTDNVGLKAYFKFNQGVRYGDNQTITTLENEIDLDGTLTNFTLTDSTSNWVESK